MEILLLELVLHQIVMEQVQVINLVDILQRLISLMDNN